MFGRPLSVFSGCLVLWLLAWRGATGLAAPANPVAPAHECTTTLCHIDALPQPLDERVLPGAFFGAASWVAVFKSRGAETWWQWRRPHPDPVFLPPPHSFCQQPRLIVNKPRGGTNKPLTTCVSTRPRHYVCNRQPAPPDSQPPCRFPTSLCSPTSCPFNYDPLLLRGCFSSFCCIFSCVKSCYRHCTSIKRCSTLSPSRQRQRQRQPGDGLITRVHL